MLGHVGLRGDECERPLDAPLAVLAGIRLRLFERSARRSQSFGKRSEISGFSQTASPSARCS